MIDGREFRTAELKTGRSMANRLRRELDQAARQGSAALFHRS